MGSARPLFSMAAGSVVSWPSSSQPPGTGRLPASQTGALQLAVAELAQGAVHHDVLTVGAGDSEDDGVIADAAVFGAPSRHIGGGVRPADADAAVFGGQPAVGAAAHPVVVVAQCHDADAVLFGEGAGTLHCALCVQRAEAAVAVPALHTAHAGDALGAGKRVDLALFRGSSPPAESDSDRGCTRRKGCSGRKSQRRLWRPPG